MEYRRFGNTIVVRLNVGEEILEQVKIVVEKEKVKLAQINALGATKAFTIGAYSVPEQKYYSNDFEGAWEIVSLHGNVSTKDGETYLHLHMGAADHSGRMVGGHLNRCIIGATCEMFIEVLDGTVERIKDSETGLNIFKFN